MFPQVLTLVYDEQVFDRLYQYFYRDFVHSTTYLNGTIKIDPRVWSQEDGKERTFWHLVTRKQTGDDERHLDPRRAERLEWIKLIIEDHTNPLLRCFYHRETNAKKDIRYYLWAHQHDFVVILQKLGKSSAFLVTSFYVDHEHKRNDYLKRYNAYVNKTAGLDGCEWF
jgi:hypothetical protein